MSHVVKGVDYAGMFLSLKFLTELIAECKSMSAPHTVIWIQEVSHGEDSYNCVINIEAHHRISGTSIKEMNYLNTFTFLRFYLHI